MPTPRKGIHTAIALFVTAVGDAPNALADTGDTAGSCPPPAVLASLPADGQGDVPVDANIVLFMGVAGCATEEGGYLQVAAADGSVLAESRTRFDPGAWTRVLTLDPTEELPGDTALLLRWKPDSGDREVELPFSTGHDPAAGAEGLVVSLTEPTWLPNLGIAEFRVTTQVGDPDDLSYRRVESRDLVTFTWLDTVFITQSQRDEPEKLCATVSNVDGKGKESERVEVCTTEIVIDPSGADPADTGIPQGGPGGRGRGPFGCGHASAAAVLLAGFGVLRHRRSDQCPR